MPPIELPDDDDSVPSDAPAESAAGTSDAVQDAPQIKPRATNRSGKSKSKRPTSRPLSILVTAVTAISFCAAAVGSYKLMSMAQSYVASQDRFRVATRDIELTPLPTWIRSDFLGEVQRLADLPNTLNTMDDHLSHQLRDAFGMHPWVREVAEVRVTRPSRVRVKLIYREPIAAVHTTRSLETVDRDGALLPKSGLPDPSLYVTITGVRSTPTGPTGTKWDDGALSAGIAVAEALSPQHRSLGITTIDVSGFRPGNSNPGAIFLLTEHGTRVKWGRPPNLNYPGEIPVQDKIDRLTKYTAEHGSLDQPAGPYEIDITHWQEISRRPRNQSQTKTR